jgi:excisionase family DNA binding protein
MTFDTPTSKNYLTISELAAEWRCTEAHLYALIKRRILPAHKIGRRVIVDRSAAQLFIQRNATVQVAA